MKFACVSVDNAVDDMVEGISSALADGKRVVWLVCGGSNIGAQVEVMSSLREKSSETLKNLTIIPMDERYGKQGHQDSNYFQMQTAGFEPGEAVWVDVLSGNISLDETVEKYSDLVRHVFEGADLVVGTFGMGADGHTAGVLPLSAAVHETVLPVVGYEAPGFTRMTMTPNWLSHCSRAWLFAYGEQKATALHNLAEHTLPLDAMPAGLLYEIADVTVYNDLINSQE